MSQGRTQHKTETDSKGTDRPRYQREADLRAAYERADGQISEAAKEFDVSYWTVRRYLVEHEIHEPQEETAETSPTALLEALDPDDVLGSANARRKLGLDAEGGSA